MATVICICHAWTVMDRLDTGGTQVATFPQLGLLGSWDCKDCACPDHSALTPKPLQPTPPRLLARPQQQQLPVFDASTVPYNNAMMAAQLRAPEQAQHRV